MRIKAGYQGNDFLKKMDMGQINKMVACMKPETCKAGELIINEGDNGQTLYYLRGLTTMLISSQ